MKTTYPRWDGRYFVLIENTGRRTVRDAGRPLPSGSTTILGTYTRRSDARKALR